ncbi:MAG: CPBP family intramembrane glutamic endopeptidase [Verrucomicrobiia bacterium]
MDELPNLCDVIAEHKWKTEYLIELLLGVLVVMSLAVIVHKSLFTPGMLATGEGRFLDFFINSAGLQIGSLFLVNRFLKQHGLTWRAAFGLGDGGVGRALLHGLWIGLLIAPLIMAMQAGCQWLFTQAEVAAPRQDTVNTLVEAVRWDQQFYFAMIAIVFAPLMEEVVFRGVLYPALKFRGHRIAALWGTALFFALMHGNALSFVPLTVLGLAFVALYEWKGNLLISIVAHSTFNAVNFILIIYGREWMQHL